MHGFPKVFQGFPQLGMFMEIVGIRQMLVLLTVSIILGLPGTNFRGGFLKCIVFLRVFKVFCSFQNLYSYREFAESLFY